MAVCAIRLLKSIICMGYALEDMPIATKDGTERTVGIIRERGFKITFNIIEVLRNTKEVDPRMKLYIESEFQHNFHTVIIAIIFHECLMVKENRPLELDITLEDYIKVYFQQFMTDMKDAPPDLYNLHIQVVGRMAVLFNPNSKYYSMIFHLALDHIAAKLKNLFKGSVNQDKKDVIGDLLLVMMRWILHDTRGLLLKFENLNYIKDVITEAEKISEYREYIDIFFKTIMIYYINFPLKNMHRDYIYSIFEEVSWRTIDHDYLKLLQGHETPSFNLFEQSSPKTPEKPSSYKPEFKRSDSKNSQSPKYEEVNDLFSKFSYLNLTSDEREAVKKMSDKEQVEFLNMKILTTSSDLHPIDIKYMTYRDNSLISFLDPASRTLGGKTIMRNIMGRYAWQFSILSELSENVLRSGSKQFSSILKTKISKKFLFPKKLLAGTKSEIPEAKEVTKAKSSNMIGEEDGESDAFQRFWNAFKVINSSQENELKLNEKDEDKINKLWDQAAKFNSDLKNKGNITKKSDKQQHELFKIDSDQVELKKVLSHEKDGMTLLLSNLGLLSYFEDIASLHLYEAGNLQHLATTISIMDAIPTRETAKCGIIYVSRGQDNQKEILQNKCGSEMYEKFILKLGNPVPLKSHLGFQAGLKHSTDGDHSIYAANTTNEIMFHVATMMPTKEDDEQVVNKKRHVGNDSINIIWSENYRPYRRNTISSQYNDFLIIIYPMKNGLFKISVQRKDNKSIIFPWIDDMIVTWDFLAPLTLVSVASAYKKYRLQKDVPFQSYKQRNEYMGSFQKHGNKVQPSIKRKENLPEILLSFRGTSSNTPSPYLRPSLSLSTEVNSPTQSSTS